MMTFLKLTERNISILPIESYVTHYDLLRNLKHCNSYKIQLFIAKTSVFLLCLRFLFSAKAYRYLLGTFSVKVFLLLSLAPRFSKKLALPEVAMTITMRHKEALTSKEEH